ncbi:MAG: flagellar M-ring protein FliF C-terminal domain-containing protein [Vulcanimicrobiaceae bacterium]
MPMLAALVARWDRAGRTTRIALVTLGVVLGAILLFVGLAARPNRVALFPEPLHAEQVREVEERLAEWHVVFAPTSDNLQVAAGERSSLLLRLSLAGVPHRYIATSQQLLAGVGALTPASVIDAQTRAGLSADIELALRGIEGVADADVIVAPAREPEFADQRPRNSSASVRLRLTPGARLNRATIAGIRAFVAASVPGLRPAAVMLMDDRGVALGSSSGQDAGEIEKSVQSALDRAFGVGMTIVTVHVDRQTQRRRERLVTRAPLGAPILLQAQDERYDKRGLRYAKHVTRQDRGSAKRTVALVAPAGGVARLSVAVFVDARRRAEVPAIATLVAAAVGYDRQRGDTLAVRAVDFATHHPPRRDGWLLTYETVVTLLPTFMLVVAALIALRWVGPPIGRTIRSMVERAGIARTRTAVSGFAPAQVAGALREEPPHAAAAILSALPAATAAAVLDLYPPHERAAIIRRMQRSNAPLLADLDEVIERA